MIDDRWGRCAAAPLRETIQCLLMKIIFTYLFFLPALKSLPQSTEDTLLKRNEVIVSCIGIKLPYKQICTGFFSERENSNLIIIEDMLDESRLSGATVTLT